MGSKVKHKWIADVEVGDIVAEVEIITQSPAIGEAAMLAEQAIWAYVGNNTATRRVINVRYVGVVVYAEEVQP